MTMRAMTRRDWISYSLLFLLSVLILLAVRLMVPDYLVIYLKPASADSVQVFFPNDEGYSETESWVSPRIEAGTASRVDVPLRARHFSHVRLDLGSQAGDMAIEKIEMQSLFGTRIWWPSELLTLAKPVQMIAPLHVSDDGLLVHATGNDPALEVPLATPSLRRQGGVIVLLASLLAFALLRVLRSRYLQGTGALVACTLLLTIGFAYKFFPGFMSFDSFQQFRQALGQLEANDAHPVIMMHIWRLLLNVYHHAGVLLVFHQVIYWFGIALFAYLVARRLSVRILLLLAIGFCPPLLILSLHLWKDVGMMCALGIAVAALVGYVRQSHIAWLIACLLALFFAFAVRVNGFIPVMPLLLLVSYFAVSKLGRSKWQTAGLTAAGVVCLSFAFGVGLNLLNSNVKKSYGMGTLVVWDMVAISLAENEDLLPKYLPRSTTGNIIPALAAANSREANFPSYSVVSPYPPEAFQKQLVRDWLELVVTHPGPYLRHRAHLLGVMMGVLDQKIYYPYHPGIDENEFKIGFSNMAPEEVQWSFRLFNKFVDSILYRPWVYVLLAMFVVTVASARFLKTQGDRQMNLLAAAVAISGLVGTASMFVIATAADYRYITWTIFAALQATAILGSDLWHSAQERNRVHQKGDGLE